MDKPVKSSGRRCDRRQFLKTTAAAGVCLAAGARLAGGGAEVTTSRVYLVKGESRAEMLPQLLGMFGSDVWNGSLAGKSVVLKPNFNSAHEFPGSTHPEMLRLLLGEIRSAGPSSIALVDRSGMGNTAEVMRDLGADEIAREFGAEPVPFESLEGEAMVRREFAGSHWSRGVEWPRLYEEAGCIVSTCCLKTHQYGGHFTMSLKNTVGMISKHAVGGDHDYMRELHGSPHMRRMIAEINALYRPLLVVLDGTRCFTDGGPHQGTLHEPGAMLAGSDRVAIDAVGVAILRLLGTTPEVSAGRIFEQEQIQRAAELGLGVASAEQIEIVTPGGAGEEYAEQIRGVLSQG